MNRKIFYKTSLWRIARLFSGKGIFGITPTTVVAYAKKMIF